MGPYAVEPAPVNNSERTYGKEVTRLVRPWPEKGQYYVNVNMKPIVQISAAIHNLNLLVIMITTLELMCLRLNSISLAGLKKELYAEDTYAIYYC